MMRSNYNIPLAPPSICYCPPCNIPRAFAISRIMYPIVSRALFSAPGRKMFWFWYGTGLPCRTARAVAHTSTTWAGAERERASTLSAEDDGRWMDFVVMGSEKSKTKLNKICKLVHR